MEATKQCGRARLMTVESPVDFEQLTKLSGANGELCLMFSERDGASLTPALDQLGKNSLAVTALVGPEGGWTDDELNQARNDGWQLVTLGGRIMRAETSAITCAALLQHRLGDLN
jgi:16S rRNA (uracil1498-N3)-methyltransferase